MKITIADDTNSMRIIYDNKYAMHLDKMHNPNIGDFILLYDIQQYCEVYYTDTSISVAGYPYTDDEESLDDFINMICFLIEHFRGTYKQLSIAPSGGILNRFMANRDVLKPLGFKVPRRKADYCIYTY